MSGTFLAAMRVLDETDKIVGRMTILTNGSLCGFCRRNQKFPWEKPMVSREEPFGKPPLIWQTTAFSDLLLLCEFYPAHFFILAND